MGLVSLRDSIMGQVQQVLEKLQELLSQDKTVTAGVKKSC